MSTSKHIDKICICIVAITLAITVLFMCGKTLGIEVLQSEDDETSGMFTANDKNGSWDTSGATIITLSESSASVSGNGAYYNDGKVHIVYAGHYVLSGKLTGSVKIDADGDDKIWLLLDGVEISSDTDAPIEIEQADKVFLTLATGSNNVLSFTKASGDDGIDGAIFSRDDLTLNGSGTLTVNSESLHGIVCNDSLVFAGGKINITANSDAVHAHDEIKICDTEISVSAGDDGLHVGNDDQSSVFYMESGKVNIAKCYEGIEANSVTIAGGDIKIVPSDDGINANGDGNASITISDGNIEILNETGKDADGLDSNGNISITGGNLFISLVGTGSNSALDYGSENGGKCAVSGGTVIACGGSSMAEGFDESSTQGFIMQTVSGSENESVSLIKDGTAIMSAEIPYQFTSIVMSSPDIAVGDTLTLKIGESETEITVDNKSSSGGMGGFGGGGMQKSSGGFGGGMQRPDGDNSDFDPTQFNENGSGTDFDPSNLPQRPDGDSQNGSFPTMPDGDSQNGSFPTMPDGDSQSGNFPTMPDGDSQSGNFPTKPDDDSQNGSFPTMPDGDSQNGNAPTMPDDDSQSGNSDSFQKGGRGNMQNPFENSENASESTSEASIPLTTWILVLVSFAILGVGIFVAVIKKY